MRVMAGLLWLACCGVLAWWVDQEDAVLCAAKSRRSRRRGTFAEQSTPAFMARRNLHHRLERQRARLHQLRVAPLYRRLNARGIQPLHSHQLGGVTMLNERVG